MKKKMEVDQEKQEDLERLKNARQSLDNEQAIKLAQRQELNQA